MAIRTRSLGEDAEQRSGLQLTIAAAIVIAVLGGATALMDEGDAPKGKTAPAGQEKARTTQTR